VAGTQQRILSSTLTYRGEEQEDGVGTAIKAIYRDLEYAKSLIKNRNAAAENGEADEENWTFVGGDDEDLDLSKRMVEWGKYNMSKSRERDDAETGLQRASEPAAMSSATGRLTAKLPFIRR